jgi:hypothetical protein
VAEAEVVDNSRQTGQNSQRSAEDAQRRARIRELEAEIERYRQASEDALQQLDWCIGYMHGSGKRGIARSLSRNRAYIRTHLLKRAEQPVPSQETNEG